mgnify:CR=1 FL=1
MTHSIISLGKGFTLDPCKELVSPVALHVPDLGVAPVLTFDKGRVVGFVELPFYI